MEKETSPAFENVPIHCSYKPWVFLKPYSSVQKSYMDLGNSFSCFEKHKQEVLLLANLTNPSSHVAACLML